MHSYSKGLLLTVVLLASSISPSAQEPQYPNQGWPPVGKEVASYRARVMDILFPRTFQMHHNLLLVGRFRPWSAPDSQFVIFREGDQCCAVFYARARESIAYEVDRLVESGIEDPSQIAKRIDVDVQRLQVPKAVVEKWLSSFFSLNFTSEPSGLITVDGVLTELWYEGPDGMRIHFSYGDPFEGDEKKSHPVVRWMNQVRADIEKYAAPIPVSP